MAVAAGKGGANIGLVLADGSQQLCLPAAGESEPGEAFLKVGGNRV